MKLRNFYYSINPLNLQHYLGFAVPLFLCLAFFFHQIYHSIQFSLPSRLTNTLFNSLLALLAAILVIPGSLLDEKHNLTMNLLYLNINILLFWIEYILVNCHVHFAHSKLEYLILYNLFSIGGIMNSFHRIVFIPTGFCNFFSIHHLYFQV